MSDQLLKCPFCGGEAIHRLTCTNNDDYHKDFWAVCCEECSAEGAKFFYWHDVFDYDEPLDAEEFCKCKDGAIKAWNDRSRYTAQLLQLIENFRFENKVDSVHISDLKDIINKWAGG